MWNKFLIFILILLSLYFPLSAQEPIDEENPIIIWEEIPNATGYRLQIKNELDEILIDEEIKETSYKINLDPGKYSHRVGSYNKFGKISSFSEWFPFIISRSLAPEVTSEKAFTSTKSESQKIIRIEGKNLYRNTWVTLKNETESIPISDMKYKKGSLEITVDNENAQTGNYDLVLENPRKKILVLKNFYTLKPSSFFDTTRKDNDTKESKSNYPYWKEAARSTIFPGWGQVRKEHLYTAFFLDLALIGSAGFYKSNLDAFNLEKDKYNQSIIKSVIFQAIDGKDLTTFYGLIENEKQFKTAKNAAESTRQASILVASIYCINILDALLWKTSVESVGQTTSLHFYTKIQVIPAANYNYSSNYSQLELGFKITF